MKYIIRFTCLMFSLSPAISQDLQTPPLSPFAKITQETGLTEIGLEYSRPSAKGRTIFGSLVPYGEVWRTGANASTKITLNETAHIGGKPVQAGTYALYTIPGKEVWTIIIYSNIKLRSLAGDAYNPADDVFRFEVIPQKTDHYVETFTLQFSDLHSDSVHLQLLWENTLVNIPIKVEVDSKIESQMAEMMKNPQNIPHHTYFEAAQYYLNNGKDLEKALAFIDAGLEKSPENFRYGLLKAKIQKRAGDIMAARATINQSHGWAVKANNANYIEQTELFRQSF